MRLCGCLLVCLVSLTFVSLGQGHILDYELRYHASVNFTCDPHDVNVTSFPHEDLTFLWLLPSADLIQEGSEDHERVSIYDHGHVLQVREVDTPDFGWYTCVLYIASTNSFYSFRRGINVDGPYYGDLFAEKYSTMLITGAVAGAVCFLVVASICCLYNLQQKRLDMGPPELDVITDSTPSKAQFTNQAYVPDSQIENANVSAAEPKQRTKEMAGKTGPGKEDNSKEMQSVVSPAEDHYTKL